MTERMAKIPETREEQIAAFEAFSAQLPVARDGDWLGDALMRENAERCRAVLRTADLEDAGSCVADKQALAAVGADEGSAAWIAAHWLAEFHTYRRCRERIEAGDHSDRVLTTLGWAMHEMGRLHEEMRWRPGIDPKTGKAREALALSGRAYRLKSDEGAEKRRGKKADHTPKVLQEMQRLVGAGKTVSNAASIAKTNGLGASAAANRQLWHRHKKTVTDP